MMFFVTLFCMKLSFAEFSVKEVFDEQKIKEFINNDKCYLNIKNFTACYFAINNFLLIEHNGTLSLIPSKLSISSKSYLDFNDDFILADYFVDGREDFDKYLKELEIIFNKYKDNIKLFKKAKRTFSNEKDFIPLNFDFFLDDHLSEDAFLNDVHINTLFSFFSFNEYKVKYNKSLMELFPKHYDKIRAKFLLSIFIINTYLYFLNPYNQLQFEDVPHEIFRYYLGFDVSFDNEKKMLKIVKINANSDAVQLKNDDYITEINGCKILDKYFFDNYIYSESSASIATIRTYPEDVEYKIKLDVQKKVPSIEYKTINSEKETILYIKVNHFLGDDFESKLNLINVTMQNISLNGVIIDLRNNPGGKIEYANMFSSLFYKDKNALVRVEQNSSESFLQNLGIKNNIYKGPIAVLVNSATASAAEELILILQQIKKKKDFIIVGTDKYTYGKALVFNTIEYYSLQKEDPCFYNSASERADIHEVNKYLYLYYVDGVILVKNKTYNYIGIKPDYYIKPIYDCNVESPRMVETAYYYDYKNKNNVKNKFSKIVANDSGINDYPLHFAITLLEEKFN